MIAASARTLLSGLVAACSVLQAILTVAAVQVVGNYLLAFLFGLSALMLIIASNQQFNTAEKLWSLWWTRDCDCGQAGTVDKEYHASDCSYRRYP